MARSLSPCVTLARMASKRKSASEDDGRIEVENVNVPGRVTRVDATRYNAMKSALLKALPRKPPGLTQTEMRDAVLEHLSQRVFPGGEKAMWWVKCVQLDLEAKGAIVRDQGRPLRWSRVGAVTPSKAKKD
jgi:hypothetical protein